jgi:tetratricopeptide (TPR) repeat protein
VVGSPVLAQSSLQEAVTQLRLGEKDAALEKLKQILAEDPSNEQALELYNSVSQNEWYLLVTSQGEIQQIAQLILDRAKVERKQASRDSEAIHALVAIVTASDSNYGQRQTAINKLIADHGEFAVPALVEKLGNPDEPEAQIQAINALSQLRSWAVLPLIQALHSSNSEVVMNAAAALNLIGDDRATGAMASLANSDDTKVSTVARKYLEKKKASGGAVDLLLAQGREYLKGNIPVGGHSEVVWSLVDDKLVHTDVPSLLYPSELAKACAQDAVRAAPANIEARSLLAQSNLAQANLIEASVAKGDEALQPLLPLAAELKITALASGLDALRLALDAGVQQGLAPVAIGAIEALQIAESADTIEQSTLMLALNSSDKRIRYAAANALVRATGGARVPQRDMVVAVLADAVGEQAIRTIQVIAPQTEAAAAVQATSGMRGYATDASETAVRGMRDLLVNPNIDVVVINENLPDRMPEEIISNIRKDDRMANTKVVIIAKDVEKAQERFGEGVGVVQAPLTGDNLIEAVNTALEGVASPAGERAESAATKASQDLLAIAEQKGDINKALQSLGKQLDRGDAVSIPAARAIGLGGKAEQLADLLPVLAGSGSVELKAAAAEAIGNVLARMPSCPEDVAAALGAVLESDADVKLRTAAATAVSKARMDNAKKAELMKKLGRVAGSSAGEG